jgi:hypothetical protein
MLVLHNEVSNMNFIFKKNLLDKIITQGEVIIITEFGFDKFFQSL